MARHRTPTALKELRGTAQPCRTNPREPKPRRARPKAPEHLSDRAKETWGYVSKLLDGMGILTIADALALEGLCEAYAEMIWARERIRQYKSPTYRQVTRKQVAVDAAGNPVFEEKIMIRAVPEVAMAADAERRFKSWLGSFGLTPADRSKVSGPGGESEADAWSRL